jgi:hypothetical protein
LRKKSLAFTIYCSGGFKKEGTKVIVRVLEISVIFAMFEVIRTILSWRVSGDVRSREGASNRNINTKAFTFTPHRNCHITWATAWFFAFT